MFQVCVLRKNTTPHLYRLGDNIQRRNDYAGTFWFRISAFFFWWLIISAVPLGLVAVAVDAGLNAFVAEHHESRYLSWLHNWLFIHLSAVQLVNLPV